MRLSALLLAGPVVAGTAAAQTPIHSQFGQNAGDLFGIAVAGGGHLDLDGVPDFLVGASRTDFTGLDSGSVYAYSGATGLPLYRMDGAGFDARFGRSVAFVGDVNGDGRDDWAVGSHLDSSNGFTAGAASLRSGADGSVIWSWTGSPDANGDGFGDVFGASVAGAGDVNKDGIPDVVVGAPGDFFLEGLCPPGTDVGYARVYSGATGLPIHTVVGDTPCDDFGRAVAGAGDLNGDGWAEFAIGAPQTSDRAGYVRIYSGRTGLELRTYPGSAPGDYHGICIANAGDTNNDGLDDLLVGSSEFSVLQQNFGPGRVDVYSGANGQVLQTQHGLQPGDAFGQCLAGLGDVNGDGRADYAVGAWGAATGPTPGTGRVGVFSGIDGAVLRLVNGELSGDGLGFAVSAAGDVNADGTPDLLAGALLADVRGTDSGAARVRTIDPLTLDADRYVLSAAQGGTQTMTLDAGASYANELYAVLGTVTGTFPGFPIDAVILPINFDAYTILTFVAPNVPPYAGSVSFLDPAGLGLIQFVLPPAAAPPNLIGLTLHHAALVFQLSALQFTLATNPIPLSFAP